MSNSFSYWNGQPLNAAVYPQMGDLMQPQQQQQQQQQLQPQPGRGAAAAGFGAGGWAGQPTTTTASQVQSSPAAYSSAAASPGPYAPAGGAGLGLGQGGMAMANMNPGAQMGMGDYGNVSSPLTCNVPTNFFSQGQSQYEPCIDNGEAFCAYNGMDMSMNYGGAQGKGGFW
ncbi:hypothetical protein KR054_008732 [Drosophila jambulina]|nr:hypothetical protein KR054_008732 [Drosophila jambulina]